MQKVKIKNKPRFITIEPLFKIGDRVMLKENLLIVEINDIFCEKNKYKYKVFYPHLVSAHYFVCYEDELEEKPFDYNQIIFNAYIEYRHKYEDLLERLKAPSVRQDY